MICIKYSQILAKLGLKDIRLLYACMVYAENIKNSNFDFFNFK